MKRFILLLLAGVCLLATAACSHLDGYWDITRDNLRTLKLVFASVIGLVELKFEVR